MEFKGTKGKWSTNTHSVFIGNEELIDENVICRLHNGIKKYMGESQKANALLISKAPEMLEAMQDFCRRVDCGEVRSKRTYTKFKELIKSATEI
ncbi:hypothetical protein ACR79B_20590 [Sphingobacterium spiritivorum]|uniref:hypothetical protein n=1 Tax=Sphingobacterium spiritivorum TaxID=258 RepID=UPI003DA414F7